MIVYFRCKLEASDSGSKFHSYTIKPTFQFLKISLLISRNNIKKAQNKASVSK